MMNKKTIYESNRTFSLYGYVVNHGLLLLRSGKSNEYPHSRVDILFRSVIAMEIRAWIKGIKIDQVDDPKLIERHKSNPVAMMDPEHKIYILTGLGSSNEQLGWERSPWQGFIVGGPVATKEDDGDMFGPSALVEGPPVKRWTLS